MSKIITIAKIGAPYGIKGAMKLQNFCESIDAAKRYSPWYILEKQTNKWNILVNKIVNTINNKHIIEIPEINSREAAKSFTNRLIGVNRDSFPKTENNEFYWSDLIGLNVVTKDNKNLGVVDHLIETGAHDVLVCLSDSKEHLIPFANKYVIKVNSNAIVVDWNSD